MKESAKHIKIKRALFVIIVSLLILPFIQQVTGIVKLKSLKGSYKKYDKPDFTIDSWFNGTYQTKEQDYLNQNIGFRTVIVRFYNQFYYSLFNIARANSVIIGKKNYLYEENYIKAYLGRDFIGKEQIVNKVSKLNLICDTLNSLNIDLIVVFAPGKGSFYNEYIPDEYEPHRKSTTNYEVYCNEIAQRNIHFLDFNRWFLNMKDTSRYPLFPKTGIHWSKYGELLAADSILRYIESIKEINMPEIFISKIETSRRMRDTDDDIERGMNLLFDIGDLKMAYPSFKMVKDSSTSFPKVLSVADSYFWGMFNWGLSRDYFGNGQFWFYNKQIYPDSFEKRISVSDIDIKNKVKKNDVVILLSTDANLYKFAFGFIDQLHDAFFNEGVLSNNSEEAKIQSYVKTIKASPEWLEKIKLKAKDKNIPLETAIRKDAEYMVWKEKNN